MEPMETVVAAISRCFEVRPRGRRRRRSRGRRSRRRPRRWRSRARSRRATGHVEGVPVGGGTPGRAEELHWAAGAGVVDGAGRPAARCPVAPWSHSTSLIAASAPLAREGRTAAWVPRTCTRRSPRVAQLRGEPGTWECVTSPPRSPERLVSNAPTSLTARSVGGSFRSSSNSGPPTSSPRSLRSRSSATSGHTCRCRPCSAKPGRTGTWHSPTTSDRNIPPSRPQHQHYSRSTRPLPATGRPRCTRSSGWGDRRPGTGTNRRRQVGHVRTVRTSSRPLHRSTRRPSLVVGWLRQTLTRPRLRRCALPGHLLRTRPRPSGARVGLTGEPSA